MGVQLVDTAAADRTKGHGHSGSDPQWTDAILPYASSGAHFMSSMR
eukprot:SAG31_NODE_30962_length_374_cov_0.734545_2_plen_45_part_01